MAANWHAKWNERTDREYRKASLCEARAQNHSQSVPRQAAKPSSKRPKRTTQVGRDIRAANVGQQLSENVSRHVLLAAVVMQLDYVERIQKEGANSSQKIASPRLRESVGRLPGVGPITFNKVNSDYFNA